MNQFYITLPSNTVDHLNKYKKTEQEVGQVGNTQSDFRVQLPSRIQLEGEWEVALSEIIYPHSWYNIDTDNNTECHLYVVLRGKGLFVIAIESGCYETPQSLCEAITQKAHTVIRNALGTFMTGLTVMYDPLTRRCSISCGGEVLKIGIGAKLCYMLGLDLDSQKPTFYHPSLLKPKYPVDLRGGFDALYVYCDLVENQVVGDVMVPLLRVVNIEGQHDDVIARSYNNLHYLPLAKQEFSNVEINIKDDTNTPVRFKGGKVVVKLHFRKRKFVL